MSSSDRLSEEREQRIADGDVNSWQPEAERYRHAAEDALQQLDWCIGYLHGIRKVRISRALARNREIIRTNMLKRPEQPLPTAVTGE